jgi:hypothetical protein
LGDKRLVKKAFSGPTGTQSLSEGLATNQKVAGSSPAERATKTPRFARKTRS